MASGIFAAGDSAVSKILPCYPGYAMGSIIRNADLELPYLEQQLLDLEQEISKIERLKKDLTDSSQNFSDHKIREMSQKQVIIYNNQIKRHQENQRKISSKVEAYQEEKEEGCFHESMLPIDDSLSRLRYEYRSTESENMHFVILKKQSSENQVIDFINHLTKLHYLPSLVELIDQISGTILKQLKQEDQEICLLGSFITLPRVKVMDPIVIRRDAILSAGFRDKEKAAKYSVIAEAVLGGVFIGFGSRMNYRKAESESDQSAESVASSLSSFSFVSQGAIPQAKTFNLWETYSQWKERLLLDSHCGFPTAFKVRNLLDVLRENGFE